MKCCKVSFKLKKVGSGVTVEYRCLYTHPSFCNIRAEITVPNDDTKYQCGAVKFPEWSNSLLFLHGFERSKDNDVITRSFDSETAAKKAIWTALYLLLETDRRLVKHKYIPEDAVEQSTVIGLDGKEFEVKADDMKEFMDRLIAKKPITVKKLERIEIKKEKSVEND